MNAQTIERPNELAALLAEIRGECAYGGSALDRLRVAVALRFELLLSGCTHWRLARAERELARLHARELSRLLRQAAELREFGSADGERSESLGFDAWREAFLDELTSLAVDGARATEPLHALLQRLLDPSTAAWPLAHEIAEAACVLHDGARSRLCLGHAYLAERRPADAARVFVEALSRRERSLEFERMLEGLVRSQAALGRHERALRLSRCA